MNRIERELCRSSRRGRRELRVWLALICKHRVSSCEAEWSRKKTHIDRTQWQEERSSEVEVVERRGKVRAAADSSARAGRRQEGRKQLTPMPQISSRWHSLRRLYPSRFHRERRPSYPRYRPPCSCSCDDRALTDGGAAVRSRLHGASFVRETPSRSICASLSIGEEGKR